MSTKFLLIWGKFRGISLSFPTPNAKDAPLTRSAGKIPGNLAFFHRVSDAGGIWEPFSGKIPGNLTLFRSATVVGPVVNDPKTKTSRRKIVLADFALEALQEHRARLKQVRLHAGDKWHEQDLVFPSANGGFIDPDYVCKRFQLMLSRIGFPKMRFHDLRHSAATILLVMGVPMKVVQELLGHSTMAMTADTYSHLLPSMQEDAAKRLDEAFSEDDNKNNQEDKDDQEDNGDD